MRHKTRYIGVLEGNGTEPGDSKEAIHALGLRRSCSQPRAIIERASERVSQRVSE